MIFPDTPFSLEKAVKPNRPGTWNSQLMTVFRDGKPIGEYEYNYSSGTPFYPFKLEDGDWYALYSKSYTATRVLKLHEDSIEDWCGEEPDSLGFCPVHLFVPRYRLYVWDMRHDHRAGKKVEPYWATHETLIEPKDFASWITESETWTTTELETSNKRLTEVRWCPFGFVAGCVWGDDSSWKIEWLDLSKIAEKQFKREAKWGYVQMPRRAESLEDCIEMQLWLPDHNWVGVAHTSFLDYSTGEKDGD